jgi:hypothetical protein
MKISLLFIFMNPSVVAALRQVIIAIFRYLTSSPFDAVNLC